MSAEPAATHDSRDAWCRLYHEARGVQMRLQAENERLHAEVRRLRGEVAELTDTAPTGLEYRGG